MRKPSPRLIKWACKGLKSTYLRRKAGLGLVLLAALTLINPPAQNKSRMAPPDVAPKHYAAIVYDASSQRILHGCRVDTPLPPASMTKMMTLYLLFESIEKGENTLSNPIVISEHASRAIPSNLGLPAGESLTVDQAIQALIVRSANDVARAVAEHLSGTEEDFASLMTRKAQELGMARSHFTNASGLPDARQVSTARDMARLAEALHRDFPAYYSRFAAPTFDFQGKTYYTHNHLMLNYDGMDGLKTGFLRESGLSLTASAKRDETRLIGVVFGGTSAQGRNSHMAELLDLGFKRAADPVPSQTPRIKSHNCHQIPKR